MSLLKTNEIQNYNGSSLTLTASTVSTSAQLNTGGNISVTGSLNVSDDSTTRTNLGLGTIATQAANSIDIDGGAIDGTTIGGITAAAGSFTDLEFNSGFGSVATAYGCRAWVNFIGSGTVAIRDSGNVSSITDNDIGEYTVNFTTAMPDANYTVTATTGSSNVRHNAVVRTFTTSSFDITVLHVIDNTREDDSIVCASIFR